MKAKTIEELIKHRIEVYNEAMKKEEVKTDMASQMYLRGALEELKFIEQNIIQLEPLQFCTCKNRQDQFERGEKCICGDCENEIIQHSLPIVEPKQVMENDKLICRNCKSTAIYQEVGTFICGECNASW